MRPAAIQKAILLFSVRSIVISLNANVKPFSRLYVLLRSFFVRISYTFLRLPSNN